MKKRNRFLKIVSSITSCLAICGIFCCSIIFRSDKKTQVVSAAANIPESSIDVSNYDVYYGITAKMDFNMSLLTYDYTTYPSYSKDYTPLFNQVTPLSSSPSYDTIQNYCWVGNGTLTDYQSDSLLVNGLMFRYNGTTVLFQNLSFVDNHLIYGGAGVDIYDFSTNRYAGTKSNLLVFTSSVNSSYITNYNNHYKDWFFNNGKWYDRYALVYALQERDSLLSYGLTLKSNYNDLVDDYNQLLEETSNRNIINVVTHYDFNFNLFVNSTDFSDYYLMPISYQFKSDVDVLNCDGDIVVQNYGIVDTIAFSQYGYYYNYQNLSYFLYLQSYPNQLLNLEYYEGNLNSSVFYLSNVNNVIQSYFGDVMYYISDTGSGYFKDNIQYVVDFVQGYYNLNDAPYQSGYDNGYNTGYIEGNNNGYAQGKADGYQQGLETNGTVVSIFSGILQVAMVPVNFFLAIFNFEILGINISAFIQATLTVMVTIIVLRTIFGGKGGSE